MHFLAYSTMYRDYNVPMIRSRGFTDSIPITGIKKGMAKIVHPNPVKTLKKCVTEITVIINPNIIKPLLNEEVIKRTYQY